jgi:hypothetical protein
VIEWHGGGEGGHYFMDTVECVWFHMPQVILRAAMYEGEYCILREGTVRERRGSYTGFCCRLYPFICWIIIKEGPGNFSGGRSPN